MAVVQSTRVGSFVESFKRQRQFAGSTPKAVLSTRDGKFDAAKCSAGEMLPVFASALSFYSTFGMGTSCHRPGSCH